MSRSLNNRNPSAVTSGGSNVLQIKNPNTINTTTSTTTGGGSGGGTSILPTVLTLDSLSVRNITLLGTLVTKNDGKSTGQNKLSISQGQITNVLNSANESQLALKFNGVYFQPDLNNAGNVTLYTDNVLKLGTINNNLELSGQRITLTTTDTFYINGKTTFGLLSYDNLAINFNITAGQDITADNNISALNNLTAGQDITADNNISALNNLTAGNDINIANKNIHFNQSTNSLMFDSNRLFLMLNSQNVINASNIIIEPSNSDQDVLFDVKGNISCNSVYITSDINKKKDIREINNDEIININNIKSYNFNYKSNDVNSYGFMAHEVKNIYPSLSNGETVNYIGFIPLLLEKIKIMEYEINELKKKFIT
jgi:hypothetical protein